MFKQFFQDSTQIFVELFQNIVNPSGRWSDRLTVTSTTPNINVLKGHSGAELHIYFLVHLESIYYQIFFYSKIVPNCAVAK